MPNQSSSKLDPKKWVHEPYILLIVLCSATLLWPILRHASSQLPDTGDSLHNIFTYRAVWRAIITGQIADFNGGIFYPERNTLLFAELQPNNTLLFKGLELIFSNSVLAYNVMLFCAFAGTAILLYTLLASFKVLPAVSAFVSAGGTFACYKFAHLPHLQLLTGFWVLAPLLFLVRWLRAPNGRDLLAFCVLFFVQILSPGYNTIILLGMTACLLVAGGFLSFRHSLPWRSLGALTVGILTVFVLVSPVWLSYRKMAMTGYSRDLASHLNFGLDLSYLGFSVPGSFVYGEISQRFTTFRPDYTISPVFMGVAFPFVIALLLWLARRGRNNQPSAFSSVIGWAFLIGGVGLVFLSFGPVLKVRDSAIALSPLYLVFRYVSLLSSIRYLPVLFWWGATFIGVAAALLSVEAVRQLPARIVSGLAIFFVLIFMLENRIAVVVTGFDYGTLDKVPHVYQRLKELPFGAVAELPFTGELRISEPAFARQCQDMYFSTWHNKPILGGVTGFFPPRFIQAISRLRHMPEFGGLMYLQQQNVRYLLIHRTLTTEDKRWDHYREFVREVYADDQAIVLELKPQAKLPAASMISSALLKGELTLESNLPVIHAGEPFKINLRISNTGETIWLGNTQFADEPGRGEVRTAIRYWKRPDASIVTVDAASTTTPVSSRGSIEGDLFPCEARNVQLEGTAPSVPGDYEMTLALVSELVTWFPPPAELKLNVHVFP